MPRSNADYWRGKIDSNRVRDVKHIAALIALGWHPMTIWECEIKHRDLGNKLRAFLEES